MFKVPLATSDCTIQKENFWNGVFIYFTSPHFINRRILNATNLVSLKINFDHNAYRVKDVCKYADLDSKLYKTENIDSNCVIAIINNLFKPYKNYFSYALVENEDEILTSCSGVFLIVRILHPRQMKYKRSVEFVVIDKEVSVATFLATSDSSTQALCPPFAYDIELDKNDLMKISISDIELAENKASVWLADILFPKLLNWTEIKETKPLQKSLSLISSEKYSYIYQELKLRYGKNIVKNWAENTDPLKFVYEDIAIATYLLLLWEKLSPIKQNFVDLGCGNGLLVYILTQEGHTGCGIDVRSRKIWNTFPKNVSLKVETIVPSSSSLFPEADWIIGNHSDELTPWIPVIAARSSNKCNFFLLPCCSYEFNGKKYQRIDSSRSQYQEYLEYVTEICNTCGFKTEIDRLRIPSTKRICLVGTQTNSNKDFNETNKKIIEFINNRCGVNSEQSDNWVNNFTARPSVEVVRNCTKLDKNLIENIVTKISTHLLLKTNYIKTTSGKNWNLGDCVHLSELVKIISPDELKRLKNEYGGLQTLIKNHHYVFVVKNGTVQFRMPTIINNKKNVTKKSNCWFYKKHPNGCPLQADECTYLH